MALVKTYLLAPNFTFQPDGPIALGNIVADPFAPHKVLSTPSFAPAAPPPAVETAVEYGHTIGRSATTGLSLSVWAQFLQIVGANAGAERSKSVTTEYTMSALRTTYFRDEPSAEELRNRVLGTPRVRNVMRYGNVWARPVYMVNGVKIAEGFSAATERGTAHAGNMGATVPVPGVDVSVGVEVGLSRERGDKDAFRAGNEIVFAYQLLKIAPKGWKNQRLEATDYRSSAAFLGDESEEEDEDADVEIEASGAVATDFIGEGAQKSSADAIEVGDGEESCVCIAFKEN